MASIKPIIQKWLDSVRDDLIKEYDKRRFRASGKFADNLEGIAGEYSGVLLSAPHVEFMNRGRGATKTSSPSSPTLREVIYQWTLDKGISPRDGISRDSLAFLIARKIHREGYNVDGREDILGDVITDDKIGELMSEVAEVNAEELLVEVRKIFLKFKKQD